MNATARVTILMTQREKKQLVAQAHKAGYDNVSEYLRRKARMPDELDDPRLDALLDEVHDSTARANAALDGALASIAEYQERWGTEEDPKPQPPHAAANRRGRQP